MNVLFMLTKYLALPAFSFFLLPVIRHSTPCSLFLQYLSKVVSTSSKYRDLFSPVLQAGLNVFFVPVDPV